MVFPQQTSLISWKRRAMLLLLKILKLAGIALILFYILLYFFQNSMVFPATRDPHLKTPHWLRSVDFKAEDGTALHGWLCLHKDSKNVPSLLYFHGNAGNISHREEMIYFLRERANANVFIFDYRGYGRSAGSPSRVGVMQDAKSALETLKNFPEIAPNNIFYLGVSLGGAIATELAQEFPPKGLILKSTFTSAREMAPVPVFNFLIKNKFDSLKRIAQISCPKLFIHGDQDRTIPYEHGQRLFEQATEPKTFYRLVGKDHNDIDGPDYYETIRVFLENVLQTSVNPTTIEPR